MMSIDEQTGIYLGSRGDDFKDFIASLLQKGGLKRRYIEMLTDDEAMRIYGSAFTSELVDPDNNYQVLEQIGDLTGNKFIVNYMYERFPQLDCADGVKVVARLRINYGAKESFCEIARDLGFWKFISATNDLRQRKMKPLLEDVFEAFLGATERILDRRKRVGVGYAIVHDILASIFNDMDISLKYEDLYDAKTRLKELFDMYESKLGPLVYKDQKGSSSTGAVCTIYRVSGCKYEEKVDSGGNIIINKKKIIGGNYINIGTGSAALKADAQQSAAKVALKTLNSQGWEKPVPAIYQKFSNDDNKKSGIKSKETKETKESDDKTGGGLLKKWVYIDNLFSTKEKSKYQSKYQSTPLAMYCRLRDVAGVAGCAELKATHNIVDTEGMYPVDLLFIGTIEVDMVMSILNILMEYNTSLSMNRQVFENYFVKYNGEYFGKIVGKLTLLN